MSIKTKIRTIIVRQSVRVRWTLSSDHTSTCSISHSPTRIWNWSRRDARRGRWRGGTGDRCGGYDNSYLDELRLDFAYNHGLYEWDCDRSLCWCGTRRRCREGEWRDRG
jgi:hypothetical protein